MFSGRGAASGTLTPPLIHQFSLNRQCNPTNLCVLNCKFCEFARRKGEEGGWTMEMDEILAHGEGVHEVHMVGGLHPDWKFDKYVEIVKDLAVRIANRADRPRWNDSSFFKRFAGGGTTPSSN